jgi:inosose dehydratase
MPSTIELANAPCSWGVDFADHPRNPSWRKVMDEAVEAGFSAIDLGPVGYFPTDSSQLHDELCERNLHLSAGGLFDPFWNPDALAGILDKTRRTCKILKALKAPRLVIIDQVSSERGATAGRSSVARRLAGEDWDKMIAAIKQTARIARDEYGVASYLHAHAGCYIEFQDELDRAMGDLPPELVGLCVDTGHSAYAAMDPVSLIHRYSSRIGHIHLKDVNNKVYASCVEEGIDFFEAIARKIFCPLGEGVIDFAAVRDALSTVGFAGLAVIEQDVDPAGKASPVDDAKASFRFLRSLGFVSDATPSR